MLPLVLAIALTAPTPAAPVSWDALPAQRGTVAHVKDGDTLVVRVPATTRTGERTTRELDIRLYGVDAPERGEKYADAARDALALRVKGREVELLEVDTDRYGRRVAVVFVDERDVAEELLRGGFVWAFRRYLGRLEGDVRYCRLEYEAREAAAGLWADRRQHGKGRGRGERTASECVANFARR